MLVGVQKQITGMQKQIGSVEGKVDSLETKITSLEGRMLSLEEKMTSVDDRLDSVADSVEFLKEQSVTRDEFTRGLKQVEEKIVDHVDHFVKLHKKQEVELAAVAHGLIRHEQTFHGSQAAA